MLEMGHIIRKGNIMASMLKQKNTLATKECRCSHGQEILLLMGCRWLVFFGEVCSVGSIR